MVRCKLLRGSGVLSFNGMFRNVWTTVAWSMAVLYLTMCPLLQTCLVYIYNFTVPARSQENEAQISENMRKTPEEIWAQLPAPH